MKSGWTHLELVLVAMILSVFSAEYSVSGDPVPESSSAPTSTTGIPVKSGYTTISDVKDQRGSGNRSGTQPVHHQDTEEFGPLQRLQYGELQPYVKKRVPNRTPEWTDQSTHDLGATTTDNQWSNLRPDNKDIHSQTITPSKPDQ